MNTELTVTGFANGGAGIAHDDGGRVVFVEGALPGERVVAGLHEERPTYAKATVVEVLEASPHRVAVACPAAAAGAGCCDLAFVDPAYAAQLRAGALADVLHRIGGFTSHDPESPTVDELAGDPTGWRVRTRLAVDPAGAAGLRAGRSAQIVTDPCVGPVDGLLAGLDDYDLTPGAEVVAAMGDDDRRHLVELAPIRTAGGRGRAAAQRARARRSARRSERLIDGEPLVTQRVGGRTWNIPVTGFWQAHRSAPATYAQTVHEFAARADLPAAPVVWDLYGGAGVLGAALLDGKTSSIELVESDPRAVEAAEKTLSGEPVGIHRGDVAEVIGTLPAPDLVIADPPRKGAGRAVIDAIAQAGPRAIVHVGCDAASFARDLRGYTDHGYRVREWRAFDAFPLTHHVEAIALLVAPS